jgi:hypothetical protein
MAKKKKEQTQQEIDLVSRIKKMYLDGYTAKVEQHKEWQECWNAYDSTYFKQNLPEYKSQEVSNYVFSTVETVIPIMLAANPKFVVLPNSEQFYQKAEMVQKALDYEWGRTKMFMEVVRMIRTSLITGNCIIGLFWDGKKDGIGQVKPMILSPFNIIVDPKATSIDDAEFMGYATYKNVGEIVNFRPDLADMLKDSTGGVQYDELMFGLDSSKVNSKTNILYIEMYFKDYSTEPDDEGNESFKYPNGRRVIIAGDVLVDDSENPYEGGFPFRNLKCYDVPGKFWGVGEVINIISPLKYACELTNNVLDSAALTSNPVWIMDKNCGVAQNSLTNRKGLVVRKNPGTEVKRDAPPSMPAYIQNVIMMLKQDIEHISGVYDVTRGERPTGITAAAAIQALNEQAQGRIKLKVQVLEQLLGEAGCMWLKRIQQYWVTKRDVRTMGSDYSVSFDSVDKNDLDGDFVIIVAAGSTMAVNKTARLQTLVQLAQTMAEDGLPMVDRQTILENADIQDVQNVLMRFEQLKQQQMEQAQMQAQQQAQMQQAQMEQQMAMQEAQAKQTQDAELNKSALQIAQGQVQSDLEVDKQNMAEEQAMQQVLQMIAEMSEDELLKAAQENPEFAKVIEQLAKSNTQQ